MTPRTSLIAVRAAYERGRMRDACVSALPVLLLPVTGIALARGSCGAVAVGFVLIAGFVLARWRGRTWSEGAAVGAVAGALVLLAPLCLLLEGGRSLAGADWCGPICGAAGLLAGLVVGARARDVRALATGALLAAASAAMGCWAMEPAMAVGALGALAMGASGTRAVCWLCAPAGERSDPDS